MGEIDFGNTERLLVTTARVNTELTERSAKKTQYEKAKKILKEAGIYDAGFFVFHDDSGSFRFSLVYGQAEGTKKSWNNFRRFTYFISSDQTNKTFLDRIGRCDYSNLESIKDAFSVEKVNKEFYKLIAEAFYALTGEEESNLVLPSVPDDDKKVYEEFAIRLIGRIIFCWFLKHKKSDKEIPLIPEDVLSLNAVKGNNDYFHSILEPLFFEVMNKPAKEPGREIIPKANIIPFLNGGLFEPHIHDFYPGKPNYGLKISDYWFIRFFGVLEQYNFTIDENSTVDAEVSVDPEMLGRIFENLLAEVNPETGESARKSTGSYYTPRVIVDYMVDQSLIQFLKTNTGIQEEKLGLLLSWEDEIPEFKDSDKKAIIAAFDKIKIIDPACGSGAFPMGILHKMIHALRKIDPDLRLWISEHLAKIEPGLFKDQLLERVREQNWEYIRKLIIIQNSIYGVDNQTIAVEISKLRFFLSLIVDEKVNDDKPNRGIEPLPNLEFKFVAANSLIGLPPAFNRQLGFGAGEEIERLKELRQKYLRSYGEQKKQIENDFRNTRGRILEYTVKYGGKDTLALQLASWDPFLNEASDWFDPDWMFGVADGFDVVIANPPYIQLQSIPQEADRLKKMQYQSFARMGDIYCLFYEQGYGLLTDGGILSFITSNKWMRADYGKAIRDFFAHKTNPLRLIDFVGQKIFESATVDVGIVIFQKGMNRGQTEACMIKDDCLNNLSVYIERNSATSRFDSGDSWTILSPIEQSIKRKIETAGVPLREWDVHINYGIKTGFNEAFIIGQAKRDELIAADPKSAEIIRPILRGRDIKRYSYEFADLWLIATFPSLKYDIEEYPAVVNVK
ncbi:MAG: Eco57I restriction-modification methylase domain-containing protein [Candidatus Zixiibacteriota bacterium]